MPEDNRQSASLDPNMWINLDELKSIGKISKFYIREIAKNDALALKENQNERIEWMKEFVTIGRRCGNFKWPHE